MFSFSSKSTAEEVTAGIHGSGLTAIVTGATSGIGAETARVLALRGVRVVMGVRNVVAAENVREAIVEQHPSAKIDVMELDLSSFESVRNFASNYKASGLPLNILINNAGVMGPFQLSKDGIELTFATNHLGHFLLTNLLLKTMKETAEKSGKEGRIVVVTSCGHRLSYWGGIRFNKINSRSWYTPYASYGQSKLANILHANELARRLKEDGSNVTANSVHPGFIPDTNITSKNRTIPETKVPTKNKIFKAISRTFFSKHTKTVEQGAATSCYVAVHPEVKGLSGKYFANNNLSTPSSRARDLDLGKKLWDFSLNLVEETQIF